MPTKLARKLPALSLLMMVAMWQHVEAILLLNFGTYDSQKLQFIQLTIYSPDLACKCHVNSFGYSSFRIDKFSTIFLGQIVLLVLMTDCCWLVPLFKKERAVARLCFLTEILSNVFMKSKCPKHMLSVQYGTPNLTRSFVELVTAASIYTMMLIRVIMEPNSVLVNPRE